MKLFGLLVLLALVVAISAQPDGYNYVLNSLIKFQATDGGFGLAEGAEEGGNVRNTADASFLTALYGLNSKAIVSGAESFLGEIRNNDGGYTSVQGTGGSDVESTKHAVYAIYNLDLSKGNNKLTAAYVRSLWDQSPGLFSGTVGSKGSIRATAFALQALDVLGELESVSQFYASIKDFLQKSLVDSDHFEFPNDAEKGEQTYFGIVVGTFVGFKFDQGFSSRINSLRAVSGGFPSSVSGATTFESTNQQVHALSLLGYGVDEAEKVNQYAKSAPRGLSHAAQAHFITLLTGDAKKNFRIVPYLEKAEGTPLVEQVVQGTSFRVMGRAESLFSIVSGSVIQAKTTFNGETNESTLDYNVERSLYISSDLYATDDKLGEVEIQLSMTRNVAGAKPLVVVSKIQRKIGFGINVQSSAKVDVTGEDVNEGSDVSVGTDFSFDVSLYRSDRERFTSGEFTLSLSVLDSSQVVVSQQKLDGKDATELKFSYALASQNLPPGRLTFRFQVSPSDGAAAHTSSDVYYNLKNKVITSDVSFEGIVKGDPAIFNLGEKAVITISPAAFPDLSNIVPFSATDFAGKDISSQRKFFLDLKTSDGVVVSTVVGENEGAKTKFSVTFENVLESLGTQFLSFRYTTENKENFVLGVYDTVYGELVEDPSSLNFTVAADLRITDVEDLPNAGEFSYGNEVEFSFKVRDEMTDSYVTVGKEGKVLLSLQHHDEVRNTDFTSTSVPATVGEDESFHVNWKITPNAVRGKGQLILSAQGVDSSRIPLKDEEGKEIRIEVTIGGEIEVTKSTYNTKNPDTSGAVIMAKFGLTCKGNVLDNAALLANIVRDGEVVASDLIVGSEGQGYEVSMQGSHKSIKEGNYVVEVFRETDKRRLAEEQKFYQKKLKQQEKLKAAGKDSPDSPAAPTLEPLFTLELYHEGFGGFPLRPEVFLVVVLGTFWILAAAAKSNLVKRKKKRN